MNRAVLLIGVSQTGGGLGKLQAVESSIDRMQAWAQAQGIPDAQIIRRTDATGPVTVADLFKDVQALVELDTVEQLIVYFAGHGVVNNRQEYWLLSDAPVNAAAAINLDGNVSLARAGAFAHVVFLSDACRTPTSGVQYGRIIGSDIFPNITDAELERPVDIFFGTALGAPALEVVQAGAGQQYQAIYTEVLLDALNGKIPEAVSNGRVRPRPLKKSLPRRVNERLRALGLGLPTTQTPDARITSEDDAWLADIPQAAAAPTAPPPAMSPPPAPSPAPAAPRPLFRWRLPFPTRGPAAPPPDAAPASAGAEPPVAETSAPAPASEPLSTREVAKLVVDEALRGNTFGRPPTTREEVRTLTGREVSKNAGRFLESMAKPPGAPRAQVLPDRPGFEIHGHRLISATSPDGACQLGRDGDASTVSVDLPTRQGQALLEFDDGSGVLLPVIRGFVGVLRFRARGLDEVWYEPANEGDATLSRQELDFLRQAISKASALGVFALEGEDAGLLATRMQNLKFQDPALAVYAAYAFHDIGQFRRIGQMQDFLRSQLDVQLYDLALLSRAFLRADAGNGPLVPALPMLSQGWALVGALRGPVPEKLDVLRRELLPSVWSLYTPAGVQLIRAWLDALGKETLVSVHGERS